MSQPKKYKMRPARKDAEGKLQQVPIGYINGHASALASEGTHLVTPAIHNAFLCGDIEIDDYPFEPRPKPRTHKEKSAKAPAKKATKKKSKTPKPADDSDAAKSETD